MQKKMSVLSGLAAFAIVAGSAQAAVVASYDFNSLAGGVSNPSTPSSVASPIASASNLNRDAGGTGNSDGLGTVTATETIDSTTDVFTSTALAYSLGTTARNPYATPATEILSSQDYLTFTLTATTGPQQLRLTSLSFDFAASVRPGDSTGVLLAEQTFASINGGAFVPVGSMQERSVPAGAAGVFGGFTTSTIDLNSLAALNAGDTIEFRLAFGDNSGATTVNKAGYIDNVIVSGEAVPEPATLATLALGGLALRRRRRA